MEEEDYMSDKILNDCIKNNVHPQGLIRTRTQLYELEQFKKKHIESRTFKELSEERLAEGLKTALPESNKGFTLLTKMGYKSGAGIGKHPVENNPSDILVKRDNFGLGHRDELEEKNPLSKQSTEEYRKKIAKSQELFKLKMEYLKIRSICQTFDEKNGVKKPIKRWFWKVRAADDSDSDSESDDKELLESVVPFGKLDRRVKVLSNYLRDIYTHCVWCAITFKDDEDMTKTCPGPNRKLHYTIQKNIDKSDKDALPSNKSDEDALPSNKSDKDALPSNKSDKDALSSSV